MAMYRSKVLPLSVWLLCATSFFIFCQSSLQHDTLYLVMELASASSFGGKRQSGRTFSCGPKSRIIVAANTETATKSRNLWKMCPNSTVCPQIIAICGQITLHGHNEVMDVAGYRCAREFRHGKTYRAASAA